MTAQSGERTTGQSVHFLSETRCVFRPKSEQRGRVCTGQGISPPSPNPSTLPWRHLLSQTAPSTAIYASPTNSWGKARPQKHCTHALTSARHYLGIPPPRLLYIKQNRSPQIRTLLEGPIPRRRGEPTQVGSRGAAEDVRIINYINIGSSSRQEEPHEGTCTAHSPYLQH